MTTILLLSVIYLAFISLGLPDSLLGVTWPTMQSEWLMSVDAIGIVSMTLIGATIVSSFMSSRVITKLGTGKTTFISCALTGTALLGISYAPSFVWLILLVIPLGLGGGSVDAALNNYVALHFKAHHMNWLHSFWGVGATVGPLIMAQTIVLSGSWRLGYKTVGVIQLGLMLVLFMALPLWKKHKPVTREHTSKFEKQDNISSDILRLRNINGLPYALVTILLYCSVEHAIGLWGSTFLVQIRHLSVETAASWVGFYYGGITIGRFTSGFLSFRLNNTQLIRGGMMTALTGTLLIISNLSQSLLMSGFIVVGIGLAPIFPSMLHETPIRFGRHNSQRIIGIQMGFAYIGSAFLSHLWGPVLKYTTVGFFPIILGISIGFLIFCSERLIAITKGGLT